MLGVRSIRIAVASLQNFKVFSRTAHTMEEECVKDYVPKFSLDLLKGKVALITGGGSGIGFTIAEIFMRHGCNTVIASRDSNKLTAAAAKLQEATGGKCLTVSMDVRKPTEVVAAVDFTVKELSRLDIVVNNAAGNFLCPLSSMSYNAYKTVMEIDAVGTFNVSKAAYDKFLKDHGGVIVNISATLHYNGQVFQAHAGSAKSAIDALTRHMAAEWGRDKIRVVGIAPGPIGNTVGYKKLGGSVIGEDVFKHIVPLQRAGTRLEIAHAALFVASEAGSYITGHTLVVDGGAWLNPRNSFEDAKALVDAMTSKV